MRAVLPDVGSLRPGRQIPDRRRLAPGLAAGAPDALGLVVFGTRDGVVGVGCLREIADARRAGLPVAMLDHRCRARTYAGLALPARAPTPRRAAVLVPGGPVDLRELFGIDEGAA